MSSPPSSPQGRLFRKRRLSLTTRASVNELLDDDEQSTADGQETDGNELDSTKKIKSLECNGIDKADDKSQEIKLGACIVGKTLEAREIGSDLSDVDKLNLPFPREVVGIYTCSGLEPIYGSSDENSDDQGNADDSECVVNCVAKINQDRGGVTFPYGSDLSCALFAACDGHGEEGGQIAQYAMDEIRKKLENHENFKDDIFAAFHDVFQLVDQNLKKQSDMEPMFSGSTACVVLMRDKKLYIGNVGDSRCVLATKNSDGKGIISIDLSVDHNPDSPIEKERIEKSGGFVSPPPEEGLSARVWLDKEFTQIGLAMSRSIGDHAVEGVGVIADPVVTSHTLAPEDDFLIIATDGVWEFISSEEAVQIISKVFAQGKNASDACEKLIEHAASCWRIHEGDYRDDITAVIVRLNMISPCK